MQDQSAWPHLVYISLLKQLICTLQGARLVNCGGITKGPNAAVAALHPQELVSQKGPAITVQEHQQTAGLSGCSHKHH